MARADYFCAKLASCAASCAWQSLVAPRRSCLRCLARVVIPGPAGRRPAVACDLQDPETFALLLLRAPGPANDPRYDRLDPSVGLDLNLADRCVIEYPQIVVARPGDVDRRFRLAPNPVQLFFADDQSTSALHVCSP